MDTKSTTRGTAASSSHAPAASLPLTVGVIPSFVSADEVDQASHLQAEYERLQAQHVAVESETLLANYRAAKASFLKNPSAENFAALKAAASERSFWEKETRVRTMSREAAQCFLRDHVGPWALPIVERGLAIARRRLADVTEEENARHLKLTGQPVRKSDILEAARRPVIQLEEIRGRFSTPSLAIGATPNALLKELAALCDSSPGEAAAHAKPAP